MEGVELNSLAGDDVNLLARCQHGDRLAQRALYDRFHRKVYGLAYRLVGHAEAADLTQEIFLRVFTGLKGFRGTACFSTWLYRIAINECLRFRRSARPALDRLAFDPQSKETAPGAVSKTLKYSTTRSNVSTHLCERFFCCVTSKDWTTSRFPKFWEFRLARRLPGSVAFALSCNEFSKVSCKVPEYGL